MTEPLDRDDVIALLNTLGSDQDDEVLEAARQVHARVEAAGISWEELLVPDSGPEAEDDAPDFSDEAEEVEDDEEVEDSAPEEEAPKSAAEKDKANRETLALIESLLARKDNSEDFRAELEDYKSDIAADEFAPSDHRYIQALHKRLTGKR